MRFVVIEDKFENHRPFRTKLKLCFPGCEVKFYRFGEDALEEIDEWINSVDFLFVDIELNPVGDEFRMSGIHFIIKLRKKKRIPFAFWSSNNDRQADLASEVGFPVFMIDKHWSNTTLKNAVKDSINEHDSERTQIAIIDYRINESETNHENESDEIVKLLKRYYEVKTNTGNRYLELNSQIISYSKVPDPDSDVFFIYYLDKETKNVKFLMVSNNQFGSISNFSHPSFVQINRGNVVNMNFIIAIERDEIILKPTNCDLPKLNCRIGKSYRDKFLTAYSKHLSR